MSQKTREFSKAELSRLSSKKNLHLLISGKVYNVHEFLHEHPGGDLVLLGEGGQDATKAFEDIQHSDEAKKLLEEYLVGYCSEEHLQAEKDDEVVSPNDHKSDTRLYLCILAVICIALFVTMLC